MKNKIIIGAFIFSIVALIVVGIMAYQSYAPTNNESTNTKTVSKSDNTIETPYTEEEAYAILSALDDRIDAELSSWLFENEPDAVFYICDNETTDTYDQRVWHKQTGRSLFVLTDEYNGVLDESVAKENADEGVAHLLFAGDVSFAPDYSHAIAYANGGIRGAFSDNLIETMRSSDIFMINNEFCYSDRGAPQPGKKYTFRADPARVSWLDEMGVDIVSLANNHAFDYGEDAFLDTLETLNKANMPFVGGGHNIEEAASAKYFIINGLKIGYLATTEIERALPTHSRGATEDSAGLLRCNDPAIVLEAIEKAKGECDYVIVVAHWGTERVQEIQYDERDLGYAFIDAGADIVVGGHPHVVQGMEYYRGAPIYYSLGNFSFNDRIKDCCVLNIDITEDGVISSKFIPCIETGGVTIQCTPGDGHYEGIIEQLNRYSADGITIEADGSVVQMLR